MRMQFGVNRRLVGLFYLILATVQVIAINMNYMHAIRIAPVAGEERLRLLVFENTLVELYVHYSTFHIFTSGSRYSMYGIMLIYLYLSTKIYLVNECMQYIVFLVNIATSVLKYLLALVVAGQDAAQRLHPEVLSEAAYSKVVINGVRCQIIALICFFWINDTYLMYLSGNANSIRLLTLAYIFFRICLCCRHYKLRPCYLLEAILPLVIVVRDGWFIAQMRMNVEVGTIFEVILVAVELMLLMILYFIGGVTRDGNLFSGDAAITKLADDE